ncbi:MAG: ATP-binding protein [Myxococcota bacterium]|nr:ATP-binding protein [Myxococcota bacterium]
MIERRVTSRVEELLASQPAVALLGPRQVGKTTLALELAERRPSIYLDLESDSDLAKLAEPELYLAQHEDELVVLDEVHRVPDLFRNLRGLIDRGRRRGRRAGRFLLLGSASIDLLRQSGESLAGRIAYVEMTPLDALEVAAADLDALWVRGGFPESFTAADDAESVQWRRSFVRTYLERDVPTLGPRVPAETLRRFWTMLAHEQGGLLNAASLARGLGVSGKTVASYLDLLVDLLLVRRLEPWHANVGKRLVKSPRVYVRDSGIVHALLGIRSREDLLGHPVVGGSWEGFVIETLAGCAPDGTELHFYRTSAGAEVDLVLSLPGGARWVVEIKRSLTPKPERGFHHACEDLEPDGAFVVYPGSETYPLGGGVEAIPLRGLGERLLARR